MDTKSNAVELRKGDGGIARAAKSAEETLLVHLEPQQLEDYRLDTEDKYLLEAVLQVLRYVTRGLASEYVSAAMEMLIRAVQRHREVGSPSVPGPGEQELVAAAKLLEHFAAAKKALELRKWISEQLEPKRLLLQDQQEELEAELREVRKLLRETRTNTPALTERKAKIEDRLKRLAEALVPLDELRGRIQTSEPRLRAYVAAVTHALKGPEAALLEEVLDTQGLIG